MRHSLSSSELVSVLEGLVREEYHLLLGAGATVGCRNGVGEPLPTSAALTAEMARDFSLQTEDDPIDLRAAYELIEGRTSQGGLDRSAYMKQRFSNCEPSWHENLLAFRWRRAWTLSIDDVIERTFTIFSNDGVQKPVSYSWSSLYSEPDRSADELQIIHLHGFAPNINATGSDLVFSIMEYLQASAHLHAWHHVFGDEFRQRPFIIVGAKLSDEYDLANFLRRGNTSKELNGRPSLIVLKTITALQREQFKKWGLLPIEAEASEFFRYIAEAKKSFEPKIPRLIPALKTPTELTREARIFSQQFKWLRLDSDPPPMKDHDFYRGDQPLWQDILSENDARFEVVDQIVSMIPPEAASSNSDHVQLVICLNGPRGSGKSATLLRCCRQLIRLGYDVFAFRAEERLDVSAVRWWLEYGTRCVLLFDGLADFANDVGRLAENCRRSNLQLAVVAAERDSRRHQVYQGISPEYLKAIPNKGELRLTDSDIDRLIEKLESSHRLGTLTPLTLGQQREYFRRGCKRQLLIGMMGLEGGKGFVERLKDEYAFEIGEPALKAVYALCCMSFNFGYPLPHGVAMAATGVTSDALTSSLRAGGKLSAFIRAEPQGLRPRHRVIAAAVVNNALSKNERFPLLLSLTTALSPYVTRQTILQSSLPSRMIKQLMDEHIVHSWVGSHAPDLYAGLQDMYGWNARYWEQRALGEARIGAFPKALSFSEEALRIHKDAFTLTTAGTILLRMATDYYRGISDDAGATYWRGVAYLKKARELGAGRYEHPFNSFFSRTLQYARHSAEDGRDPRLLDEWQRWMREAEKSMVFGHEENYVALRRYHADWLSLMVNKP